MVNTSLSISKTSCARSNILKVATRLFLAHGFSGTPMREIAQQANVSKGLLYHHFIDKAALWKTVKEQIAHDTSHTPSSEIPLDQGLHAFLEAIVWQRFELYQNNPQVIRLMAWQSIEESQNETMDIVALSPLGWLPMIKTLQHQQVINPDLDPHQIIAYIAGALFPVTSLLWKAHFSKKSDAKKYVEWVIPMIEKNLSGVQAADNSLSHTKRKPK